MVLSDGAASAFPPPASSPAVPPLAPQLGSAWLTGALPPGFLDLTYKSAKDQLLQQFEQLFFGRLAERHGSNISRIAAQAGVDRQVVRKLLRRHGLLPDDGK